jgi:asparagine synthase (glutamine-hydrolysing)
MLSGGLDSSTIAALAVRHVEPRDLTAYSIDFGLPNDESAVAARFARELGIRHQAIQIREEDLRDQFDPWLDTVDAPSGNPTWIAVTQIARLARADGIKVLLSGDGGDELFGGYSRWMTYLRFHDRIWSRAPGRLKEVVGRAARPFARGLAGDISRRAMDGGELFVGSRPFHDDDLNHCLGPVGRDALIVAPPERHIEALRERFDARYGASDYLAWMSYVSFKTDLVEDYLARLDKMGMQESVEGRVPLLDPRLVRWSFPIPQAQKVPSFAQKALFRRSVQRLLPEYITQRPKQGFCPPVAEWAQSLLLDRLDGAGILVDEGLIAPGAVDRLRRGPSVGSSFALWTLGTLSTWAELNL